MPVLNPLIEPLLEEVGFAQVTELIHFKIDHHFNIEPVERRETWNTHFPSSSGRMYNNVWRHDPLTGNSCGWKTNDWINLFWLERHVSYLSSCCSTKTWNNSKVDDQTKMVVRKYANFATITNTTTIRSSLQSINSRVDWGGGGG